MIFERIKKLGEAIGRAMRAAPAFPEAPVLWAEVGREFDLAKDLASRVPEPLGPPQSVWIASSALNEYFVTVFVSPAGDGDLARQRAWETYKSVLGGIDSSTGRPLWESYHTDPRGLAVKELGTVYIGSNGEGRLEVDDMGASTQCSEPGPDGQTCYFPIGHSAGIPHQFGPEEDAADLPDDLNQEGVSIGALDRTQHDERGRSLLP